MRLLLFFVFFFAFSLSAKEIATTSIDASCYGKDSISPAPATPPIISASQKSAPKCEQNPTEKNVTSLAKVATNVCDFPDENMKKNCLSFMSNPCIPKDALEWTLKVFRQNIDGLKMDKCLRDPLIELVRDENGNLIDHYSNRDKDGNQAMNREKLAGLGIKNHCQILINDTRVSFQDFPRRRTYFFLDLCTGAKRIGYFNMGTGTISRLKQGKEAFLNEGEKKTTVLGAFLTSNVSFSMASNGKGYPAIKKKLDRIPAVQLFGLQRTNNEGANNYKYLHVSPYMSSSGCPSVNEEDYVMIDALSERGPSLVVNYGPENKMEDPQKCIDEAPPQS